MGTSEKLSTAEIIAFTQTYCAPNYEPYPVSVERGSGVWVWDAEGKQYLDCLSCYSAVSQGHCHPTIVAAVQEQAATLGAIGRKFYNSQLSFFSKELVEFCGFRNGQALPSCGGAEAVESALKTARRWGYEEKKVAADKAEIIIAKNNFHGRTIGVISFSTETHYRDGFGPFLPGFRFVPFGDIDAIYRAVTKNTVGILVEPIQGEGGIIIPPNGYLKAIRDLCDTENVLFIADEIQVGLGRTGARFCCDHEGVQPDIFILAKALGGGQIPVSAIVASERIMKVMGPGRHGSTFGGYPIAAAAARASLRVITNENLPERARVQGEYFLNRLREIRSPYIKEVRGRGLLIGVELTPEADKARPFCEKLIKEGVLSSDTHESVIRFAPPLIISREEIDYVIERAARVLA